MVACARRPRPASTEASLVPRPGAPGAPGCARPASGSRRASETTVSASIRRSRATGQQLDESPRRARAVLAKRRDRALSSSSRHGWSAQTKHRGARALVGRDVDRAEVDADPRRSGAARAAPPEPGAALALSSSGASRPPFAGLVDVAVPIPDEVETRARPELDQVERPSVRHAEEGRQQRPGALHLVRLHALLGDERAQEPAVLGERRGHVLPRRPPARTR